MKETSVCPYCGSKNWEHMGEEYEPHPYHCHECDTWFGECDEEREKMRHKISAICSAMQATEERPIVCDRDDAMELHIEGINEAAQGLSESEKPQVMKVYHDHEAIVWVEIEYCDEPIELTDITVTDSLSQILHWLEEYCDIKAL